MLASSKNQNEAFYYNEFIAFLLNAPDRIKASVAHHFKDATKSRSATLQ
jgi:hypothetical protein